MKINKTKKGNKMNLLQVLSVSIFKKNIDNNLLLFKMSKLMGKKTRYSFYLFLIFTVTISFYSLSYLYDFILQSYEIILIKELSVGLNYLGFTMLILEILLVSFIFGYEFLTIEEIEKIEKNIAKKKNNKKQWWRLRNMNLYFRIVSYFIIWFTSIQIYYHVVIGFIIKYKNQFQSGAESIVFLYDNMTIFTIGFTMVITFIIVRNELKIRKTKKEK